METVTHLCRKCGWTGEVAESRKRCKACHNAANKRSRNKDPNRTSAIKREWRKRYYANPLAHQKLITHIKAYRIAAGTYGKKSKAANRRTLIKRRTWLKAGDATAAQLMAIFNQHNGKCHYCGALIARPSFHPLMPHGFDHVVPRSKGGLHTASNMVPCCFTCNRNKGTKLLPQPE